MNESIITTTSNNNNNENNSNKSINEYNNTNDKMKNNLDRINDQLIKLNYMIEIINQDNFTLLNNLYNKLIKLKNDLNNLTLTINSYKSSERV